MSQASSVPPSSKPSRSSPESSAKKQRSPAEKLIVWGGIIVLLGLVALQARARVGYTMTLNALQDRLVEDEGVDAKPLLLTDIDRYVVGWPSRSHEKVNAHSAVLELKWSGLTGALGLAVAYDPSEQGGTVMALQTKGFVEPPVSEQPPPTGAALESAGEPGGSPAGEEPAATEPAATEPANEDPAAADAPTESPDADK